MRQSGVAKLVTVHFFGRANSLSHSAKGSESDQQNGQEDLVVNPGGTFQIYGTLNNPFLHNVYIEGPAGANSFLNGTNVSRYVSFKRLTMFRLGADQTETVYWDFQVEDYALAGIYTIQPFLRSRVWYDRPIWDRRAPIETAINDSDPQTNLFVQIEVKLP